MDRQNYITYEELFPPAYFANRGISDRRRVSSYEYETTWLRTIYPPGEPLCDIGCAKGDFLEMLNCDGPMYGMEVSSHARRIAQEKGILFDRSVFSETSFFGLVIMRGVLQHLKDPIRYLEATYQALTPGGWLAVLMTPNTNSPYFRRFETLPAIDLMRDWNFPSDTTLRWNLQRIGFEDIQFQFPYLGSGYDAPVRDAVKYVLSAIFRRTKPFPHAWPRSMMHVIARKPEGDSGKVSSGKPCES